MSRYGYIVIKADVIDIVCGGVIRILPLFLQSHLASMGEMIANIAHQWRQPLNELSITLFKLKESVKSNEKFETGYEHAKRVIKSMSQTIENFRNFFSVEREREIFSISSAVENALKMVQGTYEKDGIDVNLELKSDGQIYSFESQLCQAIIILLSNEIGRAHV